MCGDADEDGDLNPWDAQTEWRLPGESRAEQRRARLRALRKKRKSRLKKARAVALSEDERRRRILRAAKLIKRGYERVLDTVVCLYLEQLGCEVTVESTAIDETSIAASLDHEIWALVDDVKAARVVMDAEGVSPLNEDWRDALRTMRLVPPQAPGEPCLESYTTTRIVWSLNLSSSEATIK